MSDTTISYAGFELDTNSWAWSWTFDRQGSIQFHVLSCVVYLVLVELLKFYVAKKKATAGYKPPAWLEPAKFVHNLSLSFVSLVMAIVMVYEMVMQNRFVSWHAMACVNIPNKGLYGIANFVYLVSKLWEWVDTFFLVLSDKPVIILHSFHHMTTFTMAAVVHNFPVGGYCFINCIVHFVMYLHYANPVKWARPFMTSGQLVQFVIVLSIHTWSFFTGCFDLKQVFWEWVYCQSVVLGYFVLFVNFFMQQYVKKPNKSKVVKNQ